MLQEYILSARVPAKLVKEVDKLAKKLDRSRSWLLQQALRNYVMQETEYLRAVDEGIAAYERGEIVSHESVKTAWRKRKERLLRKP